jgi:RNA polymerase sigma-70 factor, ECF subfamily
LQALIAAEHAKSPRAHTTDWNEIAALYAQLETLTDSPIVRLNRAVAVAEAHGPSEGLELLVGLDELLPTNHRVHAVRAELAKRANDKRLARAEYLKAIALCGNDVERAYLQERLNDLS